MWSGRVKKMRVGEESGVRGEERARPTSCHHLGPGSLPARGCCLYIRTVDRAAAEKKNYID